MHNNRSQIESLQLEKLRQLLGAIVPANPFYARKLATFRSAPPLNSLGNFARLVPFTTKHELVRSQLEHPPYGADLTFPLERYTRCHQTSGSTATPIRWLDTPESWGHLVSNWVRILDTAGVTRRDRFLFAFSFGPFLGFWSAFEAALQLGCFCFPAGAMTSLGRWQSILDNGITVLCCTPTYAQRLGEVAREKKLDLSRCRVRLLMVAGEAGGSVPAVRARLESFWAGATVFDHHGMTEVGPVTHQCPACPGVLHVLEAAYLPEVVNPQTGAPAAAGEIGELVLTTLDRVGSPLLRYRTGDLVKPRPPGECVCGRHDLALDGGILGRSDDMVVIRGVNVFPTTIDELVRAAGEVAEYRVNLDYRGPMLEMSLDVEPAPDCPAPAALLHQIEHSIQTALNLRVPVRLAARESLPRFEMKARRWAKITG
ncbi:MAG: AMP-binding protein [Verrucomicrobia bacterium]|nr:AMP-binding protein [Verrucomicrobiota bacterium]